MNDNDQRLMADVVKAALINLGLGPPHSDSNVAILMALAEAAYMLGREYQAEVDADEAQEREP